MWVILHKTYLKGCDKLMSICLFCSLFNLCSSYAKLLAYSLHSTYLFLGSSVFAIGYIVSN
jgi:hypothetical protein